MSVIPKPHIKAERALTTRKRDGKPILQTLSPEALVQKIRAAAVLIAACKEELAGNQTGRARLHTQKLLRNTEKAHDRLINEAKRRNRQNRKVGAA